MNISQFLQALITITLEDLSGDKCFSYSKDLVECLRDTAGLDRAAQRECITCPLADSKDSKATTCRGFEGEGFCDNVEQCKQKDCPTACWNEFDPWLKCKLEVIGCGEICKAEDDGFVMIA